MQVLCGEEWDPADPEEVDLVGAQDLEALVVDGMDPDLEALQVVLVGLGGDPVDLALVGLGGDLVDLVLVDLGGVDLVLVDLVGVDPGGEGALAVWGAVSSACYLLG